jgi:hypothetical protein
MQAGTFDALANRIRWIEEFELYMVGERPHHSSLYPARLELLRKISSLRPGDHGWIVRTFRILLEWSVLREAL